MDLSKLITPNIPIIGQQNAATVGDFALAVNINCPCGNTVMMVGSIGVIAKCSKCESLYRLNGWPTCDETGRMEWPLGRKEKR